MNDATEVEARAVAPLDATPPTERASLPEPAEGPSPRRLRWEIAIVLGLSLGQSAAFAIVQFIQYYVKRIDIGSTTSTLNTSRSTIAWIDLISQVLVIGFRLMPVLLVLYLLSDRGRSAWRTLGLTGPWSKVRGDAGWMFAIAAAIGLPGLGLYLGSRALGLTVSVDTSGLPSEWWAATILLLSAASIGILEETIAVGYLVTRLRELRWGAPAAIVASALLRGSYHLYQGWPMALGNVAMGLVFAYVFVRRGRLGPLIAAHLLIDAVAFIGPTVAPESWLAALGLQ
ncbi:CPBP family intramembrane glutamic endopeptidase [Demequina capsici]|uniref:CPBP family intramembrane glutamic endopeptidase n=1 Tax=Demequina capsici TaxID=3075620 RepID=A0AA96FF08_9MICO|nr:MULTISPECIES: CPBP family intramembrane glutamic endopeptidase [unclassified Demequina]WNM24378.1 CPBP family intramembrane glutamic endopeptidase [Demequina sp. OYTSA14]WNM27200.1 CPBP family intramembrane glutamic endopeptidase [Demequina sp. PMTSA13]